MFLICTSIVLLQLLHIHLATLTNWYNSLIVTMVPSIIRRPDSVRIASSILTAYMVFYGVFVTVSDTIIFD